MIYFYGRLTLIILFLPFLSLSLTNNCCRGQTHVIYFIIVCRRDAIVMYPWYRRCHCWCPYLTASLYTYPSHLLKLFSKSSGTVDSFNKWAEQLPELPTTQRQGRSLHDATRTIQGNELTRPPSQINVHTLSIFRRRLCMSLDRSLYEFYLLARNISLASLRFNDWIHYLLCVSTFMKICLSR